jgi:hypothetical protein
LIERGTWHVDFGFSVLFGQPGDVEVDVLNKSLALRLEFAIEGVNG